MKRSRSFENKEGKRCACCGEGLQDKLCCKVDSVTLCDNCNYTLHERDFLHIDEINGVHTFWVLREGHLKKVVLDPSQYSKFCKDPKYLMTV